VPLRHVGIDAPVHEIKAELFKALGHPVRVRLLELLVPGEQAVSALLAVTELEASHLSQHLGVLRRSGVVTARREGNSVAYQLAHPAVADLLADAKRFLLGVLDQRREALEELEELPSVQPSRRNPAGSR
jgi:ArsR family transcriptional regulator